MKLNKKLIKLINRIPAFMRPEVERIETFDDLLFQLAHEIDLAEEGELDWNKARLHRAKSFTAHVHIVKLQVEREPS